VVHAGTAAAVRAGRVYLALVVVGEVFVFAALALGAQAAGSLRLEELVRAGGASPHRDLIVLCALVGFGVKAGALGLHVWLPLAHPEAPTPASAVLSGVMVKAALVGWLAVLPAAPMPGVGHAVVVLGLAGALYGVVVGLTQGDPKAILAYSTVSQMGLLIAGVGAALSDPAARAAAAVVLPLFALHHGLAKGALFLGTGVARGAGRHRRLAVASLALPALALAAAPFTSGALAKGSLKALVAASGAGGPAALVLLSLSSAGTLLLLSHLLRSLRLEPTSPGVHPAGPGEGLPYLGLVAATLTLPFLLASPGALADRVLESGWPVALGAAAGVAFAGFPAWPVPPGDVLALYERLASRLRRPVAAAPVDRPPDPGSWLRLASAWAAGAEARLLAVVASGATLVALLGAMHLLLGG
jgi:formate hydrogenlyase subunit 3/multisubunit Na+/H+ antiporter MnhD subunit